MSDQGFGQMFRRDTTPQSKTTEMHPGCEMRIMKLTAICTKLIQQTMILRDRISVLEAQGGGGAPLKAEATSQSPSSAPPRAHHRTRAAMTKYAPELSETDCIEWYEKLPKERVHTRKTIAAQYGMEETAAQRILYWLCRKDYFNYDETKKGYICRNSVD